MWRWKQIKYVLIWWQCKQQPMVIVRFWNEVGMTKSDYDFQTIWSKRLRANGGQSKPQHTISKDQDLNKLNNQLFTRDISNRGFVYFRINFFLKPNEALNVHPSIRVQSQSEHTRPEGMSDSSWTAYLVNGISNSSCQPIPLARDANLSNRHKIPLNASPRRQNCWAAN